jgi:hypothetical protein
LGSLSLPARDGSQAKMSSTESGHMADDDKAAVDIVCQGASFKTIAETLDDLQVPFDKVIVSYDRALIHIQVRRPNVKTLSAKSSVLWCVMRRSKTEKQQKITGWDFHPPPLS